MKISELSSKVDTLISLATDLKNQQATGSGTDAADDPEVAALGARIDSAIAILQGTSLGASTPGGNTGSGASSSTTVMPPSVTPPSVTSPSGSVPDPTNLNAQDPNAPVG